MKNMAGWIWPTSPGLQTLGFEHQNSLKGLLKHQLLLWHHFWFSRFGISSVQFSHSVVSNSLQPHEPQHTRPPCPSPTPGVHPNPCPLSRWCHPTISSSVIPFSSCPQSFPASGSSQRSQLFTSGGQSIRVSASTSVPPMNIHRLVGSPCSPRDSQESSPTSQFKSINSSVLIFLYSLRFGMGINNFHF